ncbi:hypothetical protein DL767_010015 [Monosporascus sp. MG133]|nr:hypothetical protein DL767_010015 [Monosporascus sp. MG133]
MLIQAAQLLGRGPEIHLVLAADGSEAVDGDLRAVLEEDEGLLPHMLAPATAVPASSLAVSASVVWLVTTPWPCSLLVEGDDGARGAREQGVELGGRGRRVDHERDRGPRGRGGVRVIVDGSSSLKAIFFSAVRGGRRRRRCSERKHGRAAAAVLLLKQEVPLHIGGDEQAQAVAVRVVRVIVPPLLALVVPVAGAERAVVIRAARLEVEVRALRLELHVLHPPELVV